MPRLKSTRPNPLKTDPTRTGMQRRALQRDFNRRFNRLKREITQLIVEDDVFGLRQSDSVFNEELTLAHLPGKHVQKSHGRRGASTIQISDDIAPNKRKVIEDTVSKLQERFGLPIEKVRTTDALPDDIVATKSFTEIILNEKLVNDDEFWKSYGSDWEGLMIHKEGGKPDLQSVIVHEYGHMLANNLVNDHPKQYKKWTKYQREEITPQGAQEGSKGPRWQWPLGGRSFYSQENTSEHEAEAFADLFWRGGKSSSDSLRFGEILSEAGLAL